MRKLNLALCAFILFFIFSGMSFGFVVNDLGDAADANTADNTCATAGGVCTLRAAVQQANATVAEQTITFSVTGTITVASSLSITDQLIINGPGAGSLIVSGGNTTQVFFINVGSMVTISGIRIANGSSAASDGAGIRKINNGILILDSVYITENNCTACQGGGIYNGGTSGDVNIFNSTLSSNTATNGGAIASTGRKVSLYNSTVANNSASGSGGGIYNAGAATATNSEISNSTIAANFAGAGGGNVYATADKPVRIKSSIIGNNAGGSDCSISGTLTDSGSNLDTDGTCGFTAGTSDTVTSAALALDSLTSHGGGRPTMALLPGSVATDAAANCINTLNNTVTVDGRGMARPQGGACDIGAFESPLYTVNSQLDVSDASPGDFLCQTGGGVCTLRAAVQESSAQLGGARIQFSSSSPVSISNGELGIIGGLTITGPAEGVSVSASNFSRVFRVLSGATAWISNLSMTNGYRLNSSGAGIRNSGNLRLLNCTVSNNECEKTTSLTCSGGGIYNEPASTLTVINSTVSGNIAGDAGGILNEGTASILNSTISGNFFTSGPTGGISASGGTVAISNSTITNNSGADIGVSATASVKNSIVSDCQVSGTLNNLGSNLDTDGSCGDFATATPGQLKLGALGSNGGLTQTHALLFGSVAIDAAANCLDAAGAAVTTDQRGVSRPQQSLCDIGSVEGQHFTLTVNGSGTGNGSAADSTPGSTLSCASTAGTTSGDCTQLAVSGTSFVITATPAAESDFTSWSNCDSTTTTNVANDTCNLALSADRSVTVSFNPANNAPVATDDNYSINEDATLNVPAAGVLANDDDAEDDPITAMLDSGATSGSLTLNANGSFSYTPNANFNGSDSFTYHANDGGKNSNVATVTIDVNALNDAPAATGNNYNTDEDTTLDVTAPGVLGNDSDVDGDSLTAVLDSSTTNGDLTLNANGSFSYTPDANFYGSDSFTYHAHDGSASSSTVTVTIQVNLLNDDSPVATDDSYTTDEDQTLVVAAPGVKSNDYDPDGGSLTAELVQNPSNGTLELSTNGAFTYTPNPDFNGTDTFLYRVTTPGPEQSNVATVTITVDPVADCLFMDDFEDTVVDPAKWTIKGNVTEDGDDLVASAVSKKALVQGTGFAGCTNCTIETTMESSGAGVLKTYGWYFDTKNSVEIVMKEEFNKFILKHRANGTVVAKTKVSMPVDPNVPYAVVISFDGTQFTWSINGTPAPALNTPQSAFGTVVFMAKGTTGRWSNVCVK